MTHNADNTNTYTVTGIPAGAVVKYFYTIGLAAGGAADTAWVSFTMSGTSSAASSSAASSVASSVASSAASSAATGNGYTILSSTSIKFHANNAAWADIHYTINNGAQQNVRMTHNADNSNTYTVTGIPVGVVVKYFYTIGQPVGAVDTAWVQVVR